jgi:NAD(P)H-dependent flavin oxidoreductase YrpB (nitropropane dioxygenase family)
LPLVPMMVKSVAPLPVLAAGGIADGRGLAAALALGAEGVLLGTRFMAAPEAPIHANYKQAIVKTDGHDTVLTEIPDLANASGRARCRGLSATSSSNDGQGVNGPCVKMRAKSGRRWLPRVQQAMLKTPHFHSVKMRA